MTSLAGAATAVTDLEAGRLSRRRVGSETYPDRYWSHTGLDTGLVDIHRCQSDPRPSGGFP
jgi:hypothetical protein